MNKFVIYGLLILVGVVAAPAIRQLPLLSKLPTI